RLERGDGAKKSSNDHDERNGVDSDVPHLSNRLAPPRLRLGECTTDVADEEAALPDAGEQPTTRAGDVPKELDPRPLHDGVGFGGSVLVMRADSHRESGIKIGNGEQGTGNRSSS